MPQAGRSAGPSRTVQGAITVLTALLVVAAVKLASGIWGSEPAPPVREQAFQPSQAPLAALFEQLNTIAAETAARMSSLGVASINEADMEALRKNYREVSLNIGSILAASKAKSEKVEQVPDEEVEAHANEFAIRIAEAKKVSAKQNAESRAAQLAQGKQRTVFQDAVTQYQETQKAKMMKGQLPKMAKSRDDMVARVVDNIMFESEEDKQRCTTLVKDAPEEHWNHAYVTMTTPDYWRPTLVHMQTVRDSNTTVPNLVVLILPQQDHISAEFFKAASKLCVQVLYVKPLPITPMMDIPGGWKTAWHKLNVFNLTMYDKIVWSDSDTLILKNIDHLFKERHFTAAVTPLTCCQRLPQYQTISGGLWILEPASQILDHMVEMSYNRSPDPEDMKQFDGRWHWGDMEMVRVVFNQQQNITKLLSNEQYDIPVGHCDCGKDFEKEEIYTLHFACMMGKPWRQWREGMHGLGNKPCVYNWQDTWVKIFERAVGRKAFISKGLEVS